MAQSCARARQSGGHILHRLWSSVVQQLSREEVGRRESRLGHDGVGALRRCWGDGKVRYRDFHGAALPFSVAESFSEKSRALREFLKLLRGSGGKSDIPARLGRFDVEIMQLEGRMSMLGWRIVANEKVQRLQSFSPAWQSVPRRLWTNQQVIQRRSYYVDRRGVQHFQRRGPVVWIQEPGGGGGLGQKRILLIVGVVGGGCAWIYFNNLQTVPYTHRRHFVLIGPSTEQKLGEQEFSNLKVQFSSKILPPIHPQTVRVRRIARDVIEAAMAGTKAQQWGQIQESHVPSIHETHTQVDRTKVGRDRFESHKSPEDLYGNEKLEDDMWVDKSRKKGLDEGLEGFTAHLENLKWEVLVVDEDIMNAFCLPGGKIVVFTGLLKQFRSDTEVASVIGHEVGHVVARHVAEKLTQGVWLGFLQLLILSFVYVPGLVSSTSDLLLRLPFSRRMESEADHIGLLLMAAAGYDPTLAPGVYEKMGDLSKQPEFLQYASTHPSGKSRAEALRQSSTMQEAVRIYSEKIAGQGQFGFL